MYYRKTLDNGIRVIGEKIPHFRSISIGIWVGVGSVYETIINNGISHFIEHMLFKGTTKRNAKDIAVVMDGIGGQLNAFTSKECTCYYAKVIDEHLELALELLSDMFLNSLFEANEIEKEKGVILEEIHMTEDSPEDLVHDLLAQIAFDNHPLSMAVLGTPKNITSFTRTEITSFIEQQYTPENVVISIAGNYDENHLEELLGKYLSQWSGSKQSQRSFPVHQQKPSILVRPKDTEQVHLCLGFPGLPQNHDALYPLLTLNNVLGGSMSSRLFQKIREDHGLTYSIYSYPSSYRDAGLFTIYAGMKPSQVSDVIQLTINEIMDIRSMGIKESEFNQAKEQLKGNYILGLESTSNRMSAIGKSELLLDKVLSPSEIIEKIDKVKIDDVHSVIRSLFDLTRVCVAAVGKTNERVLDIQRYANS